MTVAPRERTRTLLLLTMLALGALALLVAPGRSDAATLPAGFSEQVAFSGLTYPTSVRFSPDGRVFVAEKSGLIKVFDNLADTTPSVYADLRPKVHNYSDRGLLSIALDPGFPTKAVIYALYTYDAPPGGTAPFYNDACADATGVGCKVAGHLSRILADGSEQVMIEDWCQQFPSHSIGTIAFGPDGMLYASGGDGASYNYVDYGQGGGANMRCSDPPNEGGALRSQDLLTPSDPTNLNGAVIRIDPNTAAGAPGNPYAGSADPNARRIIAYGLRNPFRTTFRPGTNELWIGDVGWSDWEEIDRVTNATDAVAEDFGWPCYEGKGIQAGYDGQNLPLCEGLYAQQNAVTPPFYTYKHSDHVVPSETCPIGGSSVAGISFAFYTGGPYPPEYDGALFFADYTRKCIWVMERGGTQLPSPSNIKGFVGGASGPVELQMGRDGRLYYVDLVGGTIRRVDYTPGTNDPPVAAVTATPQNVDVNGTVNFSGAGSSDPDGDQLTYSWDLNGDDVFGDSTAVMPSRTYATAGTYTVALRVTDPGGLSSTATTVVGVGRPTVTITAPSSSLRWKVDDLISFSGTARDAQGVAIPAANMSWSLVLKHGLCPDCHEHPQQTWTGMSGASFRAPDHEYPSELALTLTATDARGLGNSTTLRLLPQTVVGTFATSPTGLKLAVNGSSGIATFTRTLIVGSHNSLSAPTPQQLRGKQVFQRWSDGSTNPVHPDFFAPAAAFGYTATFAKR